MIVKYFADIRRVVGCEEQQWAGPAPTLGALLATLCETHGVALSRHLFLRGELHPRITILVNGRNVVHLQGLDTPLHQEDVVAVFPMVAGG